MVVIPTLKGFGDERFLEEKEIKKKTRERGFMFTGGKKGSAWCNADDRKAGDKRMSKKSP